LDRGRPARKAINDLIFNTINNTGALAKAQTPLWYHHDHEVQIKSYQVAMPPLKIE